MKNRLTLLMLLPVMVATMMFALPQNAQAQTRAQRKRAYVVKSTDGKTLTFYYDAKKATRRGTVWSINRMRTEEMGKFPIWAGSYLLEESSITKVIFDTSFKYFRPKDTSFWFMSMRELRQIIGIENLNTSQVTNMVSMFADCTELTRIDLTRFDTRNVTCMSEMFGGCSSLKGLDVSRFDTRKVTRMGGMFGGCSSLTELDVSKFDTRNVTDMRYMFGGCSSLTKLDVSRFDTGNVTDMGSMFDGCSGLTELDVSRFDTGNVTDMRCMFNECSGLTKLDVTRFDTSNVTDMVCMFDE